jgi:hypothetical protein
MLELTSNIKFPIYSGIRCLMMPYIQGDSMSIPKKYRGAYGEIVDTIYDEKGAIGYLTIDESPVVAGKAHRGARSKYGRALHTEAGKSPLGAYGWGGTGWGSSHKVTLDQDVKVLIANNLNKSCALWDAWHEDTSLDGDIGDCAEQYPYDAAVIMGKGEVYKIGILTPHESLPVKTDFNRQFLRIVSGGVHGREDYFTINPLMH